LSKIFSTKNIPSQIPWFFLEIKFTKNRNKKIPKKIGKNLCTNMKGCLKFYTFFLWT
jgi:hypothetical protein